MREGCGDGSCGCAKYPVGLSQAPAATGLPGSIQGSSGAGRCGWSCWLFIPHTFTCRAMDIWQLVLPVSFEVLWGELG